MCFWLSWDRERSHIYPVGIKSNIGVTFWGEDSLPLLALSSLFCPRFQSLTKPYTSTAPELLLGISVSDRMWNQWKILGKAELG